MPDLHAVYLITDWDRRYENNRTRGMVKMQWVPLPNRCDSDGYTDLLDHPNGSAHYGFWCSLIGVASRCATRGTLLRDTGRPHCIRSLARITRHPEEVIAEALPRLAEIGWVTRKGVSNKTLQEGIREPAGSPHPTDEEGTERRKEQKEVRQGPAADPVQALRAIYQKVTTRYTWAKPDQAHDIEIDLGHLIDRRGFDSVERDFRDWCADVAAGRVKGHIWAFLKTYGKDGQAEADQEDPPPYYMNGDGEQVQYPTWGAAIEDEMKRTGWPEEKVRKNWGRDASTTA